ncbi:MAG: flagellar motor protein MotA [Lysobacteraceae bacterium]
MSQPIRVLAWMLGVLAAVAVLAVMMIGPLTQAFTATPGFNALILAVFGVGIVVNLQQLLRLQGEVRWIENFRRSAPDRTPTELPVLLAPMAKMLGKSERKPISLSMASTRTILDSVYLRLEEQRDLSRYLIGLLIFLGLLGTFWGLLKTIGSVSDIIAGLSGGSDAVAMFEALKDKLQQPLSGMATSFSTSLFGLAGSLVIGLLDLLSGRASNRFYNELEEWLSGMTKLSAGGIGSDGDASVPAYVQALLEQTADGLERMQRALFDSDRDRRASTEQMAELAEQLGRLNDTQTELRSALRALAQSGSGQQGLSEDLRQEFRLLSRTIAAAVEHKRD